MFRGVVLALLSLPQWKQLSTVMASSKFSLVRATMDDRVRLTSFLADNFYPYEPLNLASIEDDEEEPDEEDMDHTLLSLPQGRTLLAVDGDELLGVAINGDITSDEYNVRAKLLADCTCEGFKPFLTFWTYAEKKAGFWPEGEPTKALDLEILCVSVAARGRGIGRALIEGSRQVAREDGYPLFRMDCTSYYAARLAEMVGMTCVFTLPYEDYKNENGETVFQVKSPHSALNIFKQKL